MSAKSATITFKTMPSRAPVEVPVPTYEYQCNSCKAVYELRQGFDAETSHKCEECGKGTAKRVLHAPPVVFKGSGWYATDSRNKSSAIADSESKSESGSAATEAPAASKPDTTSSAAESTTAS